MAAKVIDDHEINLWTNFIFAVIIKDVEPLKTSFSTLSCG